MVTHALPNGLCQVQLANGHTVIARSGQTRDNILPGAKVMLEVSPYDLSKGRIIGRQQSARR